MGALALAALMLVTACATGSPYRPPVSHDSPETWALESEADDGGQGEAIFAKLPTDFAPVQVGDAEFSAAMATFWLDTPLRVATYRPPLYVGLNPTQMLTMIGISVTVYMALLLAPVPEPVTKGAALVFSAALWGYLGYEFFDLLRAYAQLYEDAPRASSFAELREIGELFGRVIGPNSVRILLIVGTAAIGETAALASKAPKLPGFAQASERVAASTGVGLPENVIALSQGLHRDVSAFYSSIRPAITRSTKLTVRKWLSTQSYEAQREFGLMAIENVKKGIW